MSPATHTRPGAVSMKVEYLQGAPVVTPLQFFCTLSWSQFFAYISLIIEFKGIIMKLKNVSYTISME